VRAKELSGPELQKLRKSFASYQTHKRLDLFETPIIACRGNLVYLGAGDSQKKYTRQDLGLLGGQSNTLVSAALNVII